MEVVGVGDGDARVEGRGVVGVHAQVVHHHVAALAEPKQHLARATSWSRGSGHETDRNTSGKHVKEETR